MPRREALPSSLPLPLCQSHRTPNPKHEHVGGQRARSCPRVQPRPPQGGGDSRVPPPRCPRPGRGSRPSPYCPVSFRRHRSPSALTPADAAPAPHRLPALNRAWQSCCPGPHKHAWDSGAPGCCRQPRLAGESGERALYLPGSCFAQRGSWGARSCWGKRGGNHTDMEEIASNRLYTTQTHTAAFYSPTSLKLGSRYDHDFRKCHLRQWTKEVQNH